MAVSLRPFALSLATALSLAGSPPAWATSTSAASAISAPSEMREIARVTGEEPGNYVAWVETPEGEVDVAVAATFPNRPLVAAELIRKRTPAEVFLAVAPPRTALPAALARRSPEALLVNERVLRAELRQENEEALARLSFDPGAATSSLAAGCTDSFRDWAGAVFGDASCGQAGLAVIDSVNRSDTYCSSGCDFTLGAPPGEACQSPSLKSCNIVRGTAEVIRLRTTTQGSPSLNHKGHWAHFGVAVCSGNGPVTFNRQRGNNVTSVQVPVGGMLHYPQGTSIVPGLAQTFVAYGAWKTGKPPSGTSYQDNILTVANNSGTDDRIIACGDIYTRYDMTDISSPTCNGLGVSLCTGGAGSTCDSNCFNCSGGTCN
ncbi:hypothetical protein [Pyxidicoccus xibeiensis]|uniref:hypothetical protein n=1 Tax=Pyxidicoccus xibeiensis TaxID=2906759 RepID=UPI0020A77579|nr:hypothetical protein [Pyxidicoccus xibeiensis]MCP3138916.1 hypothetical protein [Pyxidicoccus xibeiensis]